MSYIMRPDSASIAVPVSIPDGGTGSVNPIDAMTALTTPPFALSTQSPDWGIIPIVPPIAPADPVENERAINDIIATLQLLGVTV